MNLSIPPRWLLALSLPLAGVACGQSSPQTLAAQLEKAFEAADFDALERSFALRGAPAMARAMLHDMALDCSSRLRCAVSVVPLDEEWTQRAVQMKDEQGVVAVDEVLGLLQMDGTSRSPKEGMSESLKLKVPYARVDGQYRVAGMRYTPEKLAELKATSAREVAEATLAHGIVSPSGGEPIEDFAERATALPEGGGEPGAVLLARVKATGKALADRDPDAYAELEPQLGAMLYGPTDWDGNPVPMALRQRKIHSAGLTQLVEVKVLGGWQLDDLAVLVVDGRNGAGSEVRGAQLMRYRDGEWRTVMRDVIEIPAES